MVILALPALLFFLCTRLSCRIQIIILYYYTVLLLFIKIREKWAKKQKKKPTSNKTNQHFYSCHRVKFTPVRSKSSGHKNDPRALSIEKNLLPNFSSLCLHLFAVCLQRGTGLGCLG